MRQPVHSDPERGSGVRGWQGRPHSPHSVAFLLAKAVLQTRGVALASLVPKGQFKAWRRGRREMRLGSTRGMWRPLFLWSSCPFFLGWLGGGRGAGMVWCGGDTRCRLLRFHISIAPAKEEERKDRFQRKSFPRNVQPQVSLTLPGSRDL